ncbi:hypothetical protein [Saccharothrix deserti]|uniref:hypothetical protein n=1 Tax=Saccharothrix deserti TaxID=2593674 RepID=UPI00131D2883|nr:hypothetical protein [Saccharothrix deserti]
MTATVDMDSNLLEEWLDYIARDGWAFAYWPDREAPLAMIAYREWRGLGLTDVVALIDQELAFGYRALVRSGEDFLKRPAPPETYIVVIGTACQSA